MWSLLVITCVLFQTAVAIFLLNAVRVEDDVDKSLRALLLILLVHLSVKFLLLGVLGDIFMYTQIPTGFGLAYGPLLLVTVRSWMGRPMRRRMIFYQFLPFLVFSVTYLLLVTGGLQGWVSKPDILQFTSRYEWLVLTSLVGYPLYVKLLLLRQQRREIKDRGRGRLLGQIANVLLAGVGAGFVFSLVRRAGVRMTGGDLRMLPYICFSAIPLLILRHRLQRQAGGVVGEWGEAEDAGKENGEAETGSIVEVGKLEVGEAGTMREILKVEEVERNVVKLAEREEERLVNGDRRYEKSGLDSARLDEYAVMLMAYMEKSRIYLDPDLSLDELAARLKISRHHLTQLLNDRLMKNYYSFINEYRIGVAIARLDDPRAEVNILSLAFDCGFNSRSSFNNYFKKITGCTPSAYRKRRVMRVAEPGARVGQ
ncbi:MAG TPA: helix-turn-helix domain-containing protein [Puia sp.]|jgi:AraC-like DNA-binding protein|nr:helix-turn-helix domain-containing protein [Puia sp.]